jgi:hypothetical protein
MVSALQKQNTRKAAGFSGQILHFFGLLDRNIDLRSMNFGLASAAMARISDLVVDRQLLKERGAPPSGFTWIGSGLANFLDRVLHRIFRRSNRVAHSSAKLVGFPMKLEILVAENFAGDFFNLALYLQCGAFDVLFIHHTISVTFA